MRFLILVFAVSLFFSSCQNNNAPANKQAEPEVAPHQMKDGGKKGPDMSGDHKYTLTPFEPSHEYPRAMITDMTYKNGQFAFSLSPSAYKLGMQTPDFQAKTCANSAKGQHIHLIVDDLPYAAKYEAEFDYEVKDGDHYILAFISRSYHESLKGPGQGRVRKVSVANGTFVSEEEVHTPMLFYSRPKGVYKGKANTEKVMLDFYAWHTELGDNTYLMVNINGEDDHMITQWRPYYIEGLPMGENTITLTLYNKDGSVAGIPLNPVTRKFRLEEDPAEIQ